MAKSHGNEPLEKRRGVFVSHRSLLILEDFDNLRAFFAAHFEKKGFQVYSAARIDDAVALTLSVLPQLVVIDYDLLSESPVEAIKILRRMLPGSKIIVIGGIDTPEMIEKITLAGGSAFIPKGYDLEKIDELTSSL